MSLWKRGIERSKTGEKRLENKSPFEIYLDKVEWVDLGHDVLYAQFDYPLDYTTNEDSLLSLGDIIDIMNVLPPDITIMNKNHVKWLQDNCHIVLHQDIDEKVKNLVTSICCVNPKTQKYISFNLDMFSKNQVTPYYLKTIEYDDVRDPIRNIFNMMTDHIELTEIGPKKFPSYLGTVKRLNVLKYEKDTKKYMIKVVKLKNDSEI